MQSELQLSPDQRDAVQAYLRTTAAAGRDTERHGPFLATFSPGNPHPYLNYAIPDSGARPAADVVAALVAAYRTRGLVPRLEYLADVAPDVEPALREAGFTAELRPPVMVCRPGAAVPQPVPEGIELLVPATEAELLALVTATHEAYGEDGPATADDARGVGELLAAGGFAVLARDAVTGEPAGGGIGTAVSAGITELAGFGVRERYRRRGIAAAITGHLVADAHAAGVHTAFLTPGGQAAGRVYARAGFTGRTEMLHIRL